MALQEIFHLFFKSFVFLYSLFPLFMIENRGAQLISQHVVTT
jgi:hypothetical protein